MELVVRILATPMVGAVTGGVRTVKIPLVFVYEELFTLVATTLN